MRPGKWLLITIALTFAGAAALIAINTSADVYGLYRPTQARRLNVYGDARIAKYLLSSNYVPENFNAILIGGSFSANWDMTAVQKLRVYNESLNGGNIVEEKAIAEAAISRPGISTAFILVHPALTYSHDFMTVRIAPRLKYSSLGSISLWAAYKDMAYIRLHRSIQNYDYAGTEDFGTLATEMPPNMKRFWSGGDHFDIDPIAIAAYQDLIAEFRAHHVHLVFIVPPTFEGLLQAKRTAFPSYIALIRAYSTPEDNWIDFNSAQYSNFRAIRTNFPDGVHLTPEAAKMVVSDINAKLNQWSSELGLSPTR
jgi:hypothetical protein